MEVLKQEILKKKQSLKEDTGGRKFFKRSELEQKQIQKLRDQEKLELQAKSNRQSSSSSSSSSSTTTTNASATATTSSLTDEQNTDNLVLPRQEVIRRLRFLKQPITLFGEDDTARLDRLKYVLKNGLFEVDSDMTTEGQTNDFLRDIVELRKRRRSGRGMMMSERKRQKGEEEKDGGGGEDELSGGVDNDEDLKRMKANFDELCEEDKILVFFKRLLTERRQELDEMGEAEKRTAKGKSMVATFKQCSRYLNPLFKFCRKKVLPDDTRQALMLVVECCLKRDYLAGMGHYIRLAIGNAPWPIGVTMVGIHERSAREKIYTNSVAHIMNDETTRKYLQSVRGLMTFCQRRYPALPSKAVEFNSLANGSDL
ncbi:pre-mRNA-splicing factor 18-like [Quercus lobata]|uniref:Pre-mRNA-splicing factor 18 n=1 Tax=Quercus lobata TaxID=97700 RepID=A0A7N2L623_QUELO|nr:pre-mRNA-splicing factor 18-like [Quercus lobata]